MPGTDCFIISLLLLPKRSFVRSPELQVPGRGVGASDPSAPINRLTAAHRVRPEQHTADLGCRRSVSFRVRGQSDPDRSVTRGIQSRKSSFTAIA
jgi:hypothetical protein